MLIGVIYRPLNQSINSFLEVISPFLSKILRGKKECYLLGDYNVDLMKLDSTPNINYFLELIQHHLLITSSQILEIIF